MKPVLDRLLAPGGPGVTFVEDRDPTRVAFEAGPQSIAAAARATAGVLRRRGVRTGDRVALRLPTGPDFLWWFFGALSLGALPIPLPAPSPLARGPDERLKSVMRDARPKVVVDEALAEASRAAGAALSGAEAPVGRPAASAAYLQYTSGSTGRPRGVIVTWGNLAANLESIGRAVKVTKDDRVFSWLPLFHDMGLVGTLLFSLWWRLPLFLCSPQSFTFRPGNWLRGVSAHRATLSPAPHFAYVLCAERLRERDLQGLDLSSWRLALDGSEPVGERGARAFVDRFAGCGFDPKALFPVYGLAEATLAVTLPEPGARLHVDRVLRTPLARERKAVPSESRVDTASFVSVGRVVEGHTLTIQHPRTRAVLGEREVGEVTLEGPSISPGYFGRSPRRGPLRTGDLGYLAGGRLYLVGRAKDLIIAGGVNVHPEDAEELAAALPGVKPGRVTAFGAPDPSTGTERLVIAFEPKLMAMGPDVARAIRTCLIERLGISAEVVPLPSRSLPLTPSGKRMRATSRAIYLRGDWGETR